MLVDYFSSVCLDIQTFLPSKRKLSPPLVLFETIAAEIENPTQDYQSEI
jgi:hypothetical protein